VQMLRIPPNKSIVAPDIALGFGASMLVVNGELMLDQKPYGVWSALYAGKDEPAVTLTAGLGGVEVLFMRYPQQRPNPE